MQEIEGETLGEKHRNFNSFLCNAIKNNPNQKLEDIDYNQPDIHNLFQIDFACHTRNVEYLLKVFKCQDMLYVSRAIKQSVWLINDAKYAHIINPEYLYSKLLPFMITEARNKLMLSVRLHLKEPKRYEEFYNYLSHIDLNASIKFIPYCSFESIPNFGKLIHLIPDHMLLRLFSADLEFFRIYCNDLNKESPLMGKSLFLIGKYGEIFFDILDSVKSEHLPHFNPKYTKLAMKTCPKRIMFNFTHYAKHINLPSFVKYIQTDCFNEFITKYANDADVCSLFNEEKKQKILAPHDYIGLLSQIINCDIDNVALCKEILQNFKVNLPEIIKNLKFTFHFINLFIKRFKIHRLDLDSWSIYNDIFKEINIRKYSTMNKTFKAYIRSIIAYKIIHNENISEDILSDFEFDTFKYEFKKFNKEEKEMVFEFLLRFAMDKLENMSINNEDEVVLWIERIVKLLDHWDKNLNDYYLVVNKINSIIIYLKDKSDIADLQKLYDRSKFWRKAMFQKFIAINSKACVNILKHDPKLLHIYENEILACSTGMKTYRNFYNKLRTYWSKTLALHFKDLCLEHKKLPNIIGLYFLLTQSECSDFIKSNVPNNDIITNGDTDHIVLYKTIAKNMHFSRPKPSLDIAMMYAKEECMIDVISTVNSLLFSAPINKFDECFDQIQENPLLQKLYVWVAFSKSSKDDRKQLIFKIWHKTNYTSVKSEIIKMYISSLYNHVDVIYDNWMSLEVLLDDLSDEVIIRKLPSKVRRLPLAIRSEFNLKCYNLLKTLQPKCKTFPRVPLMCYIFAKYDLNKSLLAEMIDDCITKRLWRTKLNIHHIDILVSCLFTWKSDDEVVACYEEIVAPVFNSAYKMWNKETCGLLLVQYNIKNIVAFICRKFFDCKSNPSVINLLYDSLRKNVPVHENYIMITKLRLGVEYLKLLSKYKADPQDDNEIHDDAAQGLAEICIKIFCDDVAAYKQSVWKLFYHALQIMLDNFYIKKSIQYKMYNYILDMCTNLSPELDVLVHVLVMELSFYVDDCWFLFFDGDENCVDNEGQQALLERIKRHSSQEVKANYSKVFLSLNNKVTYNELSYRERF